MTNQDENQDDKAITPPPTPPTLSTAPTPEPESSETDAKESFKPVDGADSPASAFEHLLKHPGSIIYRLHQPGIGKLVLHLSIAAVLCFVVFGILLGTFRMGHQLWAAPLKVTFGVFFSALLCLPSLYIFSCLNGLSTRFASIAGVLLAIVCLTGLLLLGFSPVVWIFSQSTESELFVGTLVLVFWVLSVFVGMSLLSKLGNFLEVESIGYLRVWMAIFLLVTLQMSTSLRPLISPGAGDTFLPEKKKFFLVHWFDSLEGTTRSGRD